jgi:hypothetical protein
MTSILESEFIGSTRPYSQNELRVMSKNIHNNANLGKIMAKHSKCGHIYITKKNGRKEKEIIQQNSSDVGKCSVCWKISKTPITLRDKAKNLVDDYYNNFNNNIDFFSYQKVDLENAYYKWLYEEFN